jgi:hypothetical protein
MRHARLRLRTVGLLALCALLWPASQATAQGVTTGAMSGIVTNVQMQPVAGANVIAIHETSGSSYEATTRADGRFTIPGMRVGGPYSVTVAYTGAGGTAFEPQTKTDVTVNLGVATDVNFSVTAIAVQESITVTAIVDPVFSSNRTGAATAVSRIELATLPSVGGRLADLTRLTPQARGNSFAGADNRMNNITVDGAYFNNSFGLRAQPGETSGVAPISLESIEQVQVSIAPYDVRQGNFVGAAVNTVTRSGTNNYTGSFYHRIRNQDLVGTEAKGAVFNPGVFKFRNTGGWAGGPIVRNRLFAFGTYENEKDNRPITTFVANTGGQAAGGNTTRVLASDLSTLSAFLSQRFSYDTGPVTDVNVPAETPAKRFLLRSDFNVNNNNKISGRYNHLDSFTDNRLSTSSSLGFGRSASTNFLGFQSSNYTILENIRSVIGEWNSVLGSSMSNSLIVGYTSQDESRGAIDTLFPFVDILQGGITYTSFGTEPFTPDNALVYKTFQLQDSLTRFGNKHSLTFGGTLQRYESENIFFPGKQSAYVYNSFQDFYTDANDFLANPNRTTSPVVLNRFQVRYSNIPGQDKPIQPLQVWYGGGYAQDEWRPRRNVTVTAGLRADVAKFADTGYPNPVADLLTFRDEDGSAVQYPSGTLPDPKILWSPRVGFNWDVASDQRTQIRGGTGVFTGPPLYVWISNQIGNTGVLTGFINETSPGMSRPFHPDPDRYKPANVTGLPAPTYELALTDPDFKFPQVWRSNVALDRRLPFGFTGTVELLYNRDVNGIYYINANLPAAQAAFAGVDNRPRWTGPSCSTGSAGPCVNRLNNAPGNQVSNAIVMKNQSVGRSWNISTNVSKVSALGYSLRGAYTYGEAKNTIDPGSIAFGSWSSNPHSGDPNNPGIGFSTESPGHRGFIQGSYSKQYFGFGTTTVSAFWDARTIGNASYIFAGDANGDGASPSDLIYIPRDTSEMNFAQFTHTNGRVFTPAEQAAAFDTYIGQDEYLRKHRGEYAKRNAAFLPLVKRLDFSVQQEIFKDLGGHRNAGQFRLDIQNFGNLLNSDWGVSQRFIRGFFSNGVTGVQLLTNPGVDAQGRLNYRMSVVNNELLTKSLEPTLFQTDVYQVMLSFRYSFN